MSKTTLIYQALLRIQNRIADLDSAMKETSRVSKQLSMEIEELANGISNLRRDLESHSREKKGNDDGTT